MVHEALLEQTVFSSAERSTSILPSMYSVRMLVDLRRAQNSSSVIILSTRAGLAIVKLIGNQIIERAGTCSTHVLQ